MTLMKVHTFTVHPLVNVVTRTTYMLTERHVLQVHNCATENKVNINQTQIAVSYNDDRHIMKMDLLACTLGGQHCHQFPCCVDCGFHHKVGTENKEKTCYYTDLSLLKPIDQKSVSSHCSKYSRTPITRTLKGNKKQFE